jgi:transcription termination factor Rho
MSEPQLERSVLEGKEREELFAIADALGTHPTSRAKKSDLVTAILRATGVEAPADEPERPRRTRTRRTATAPDPEVTPQGQLDVEASSAPLDEEVVTPTPASGASESATTDAPSDLPVAVSDVETAAPSISNGKPAPPARSQAPTNRPEPGGGARPQTPRAAPASGVPGSGAHGPGSNGPAPAPSGGDQASDLNGDGQRFDADASGRRNRRRRGRDRSDRSERELQGQAAEAQYTGEPIPVSGLLDLRDEGYGFLRTTGFIPGHEDVYVSISQVRRFSLRKGDQLEGSARPAGNNEKYPALLRIDTVSGLTPDEARNRPRFDNLTPLFPDHKLALEVPGDSANTTARIVDLISPIGKGQRGLIVSPPKAGKTTVLKQIAHSIETNNPDVYLMVLLVDERPEEVTDMRRSVKGDVIASTFDRPSEEHTQVAELAIERAKRLVEQGRDVVIVLDGITRLARAYNLAQPATGRVMSGGIDTGALYPPKKFFGAARNIEEGGSLTILATALVETGSKMDEVIFEEFKGTGNMELRLFDRTQLQQVWKLRRALGALAAEGSSAASLELLMDKIKATRSNDEFLAELAGSPAPAV